MAKAKRKERKKRTSPILTPEVAAQFGIKLDESADKFLSPNDIGKVLGVTGEAVKQWIYNNLLPAVKLGNGYWKVKTSDLTKFLQTRYNYARRKVMVVANPGNIFEPLLRELGHDVIVVSNYADAILKISNQNPSMVLISTDAKDLRPWDLAEKIRGVRTLRHCSILFVSLHWSDENTEQALKLKAEGMINASDGPEILQNEIKRILGGQ